LATLRVRVVSPEKIVYQGEAGGLVAPAWDGMVGILPGHAPMIVLLGMGELTIDRVGGGAEEYHVAGGVLKVEKNEVVILTEYAGKQAAVDFPREKLFLPEDLRGLTIGSAGNPLV
jgi:F-type H+-transporting ATPase subunit epsilon